MSLDDKHRNIGATVSMIQIMANMESQELIKRPKGIIDTVKAILFPAKKGIGRTLAKELTDPLIELFMEESNMCDYKVADACAFEVDEPDACISPPPCLMANCPLGKLVDEELKYASGLEDKS